MALGGEFWAVLFIQGVPRVLRAGLFVHSQRSVLDMRCGYSVFVFFLLEVFCGGPSSLADHRHGRLFLDHFPDFYSVVLDEIIFTSSRWSGRPVFGGPCWSLRKENLL